MTTLPSAPEENMRTYVWSDALCVGIGLVDAQHKELVAMVDDIQGFLLGEPTAEDVLVKLEAMRRYCNEHFSTEEALMEPYKDQLPGYERHLRQHKDFTDVTEDFFARYKTEGKSLAWEMFTFLGAWLLNHIQVTDRLMSEELRAAGVDCATLTASEVA